MSNYIASKASSKDKKDVRRHNTFELRENLILSPKDVEYLILLDLYDDLEWFVEVITLTDGQSFGELALIHSKPRAATITASTKCSFGVISRYDYKRTIEKIQRRESDAKAEFFKKIPFLSHWTRTQLEKVIMSFVKRNYIRKQIIYKEDDEAKFIYIVLHGELEVSRIRDTEVTEDLNIENGAYYGKHISFKQKKKKNIVMQIGIIGPG